MRIMSLSQAFRPTRWKVIVSLLPFFFPLFQTWIYIQIENDLYLDVDNILYEIEELAVFTASFTEKFIAAPFEPILSQFGWWSRNVLIALPNGPLLPGSFAVAGVYALLIYSVWSLIAGFTQGKGARR